MNPAFENNYVEKVNAVQRSFVSAELHITSKEKTDPLNETGALARS
jgi:hypothetical protein